MLNYDNDVVPETNVFNLRLLMEEQIWMKELKN